MGPDVYGNDHCLVLWVRIRLATGWVKKLAPLSHPLAPQLRILILVQEEESYLTCVVYHPLVAVIPFLPQSG